MEGFQGLPVQRKPFEEDKADPDYWLFAMIIDRDAMYRMNRKKRMGKIF